MFKQNGDLYIGYFNHGKAEGKGVYIFTNGSYYEGEFNNNYAECEQGKFVSEDLNYSGGFKKNTFHGKGSEKGTNHSFDG